MHKLLVTLVWTAEVLMIENDRYFILRLKNINEIDYVIENYHNKNEWAIKMKFESVTMMNHFTIFIYEIMIYFIQGNSLYEFSVVFLDMF